MRSPPSASLHVHSSVTGVPVQCHPRTITTGQAPSYAPARLEEAYKATWDGELLCTALAPGAAERCRAKLPG